MPAELEQLYTFKEAMNYLRASRSTVQRLIDLGRLEGGKVGGEWRFTKAQLEHAVQPAPCKQHIEQTEQPGVFTPETFYEAEKEQREE